MAAHLASKAPALTGTSKRSAAWRHHSGSLVPRKLDVVAQATGTKKVRRKAVNSMGVFGRIEELRLLSKVEELGLLSKLESVGITLSKIEELGLLSTAEKSGLLSVLSNKGTPGLLTFLGLALVGGAGALVFYVPDDTATAVVAQALGAAVLVAGGFAAFTGSSVLTKLQS